MARVLFKQLTWRSLTLIACESALIVGAVAFAAYLRLGSRVGFYIESEGLLYKGLLIALVVQICLYYAELYDVRVVADRRELAVRNLQALGAASLILAFLYFWFPGLVIGRGVFLIAAALVITLVIGWRLVFDFVSRRMGPTERLLLVGTSAAAVALARELLERRHELGVEIVGFVDPDPARLGQPVLNPAVVGTIDDIPDVVQRFHVDRVVVSLADARGKLPMDKLLEMKLGGVAFDHLASVYEKYTGKIAIENLRPSWLIFSEGFRKSLTLTTVKRAVDVLSAGGGLLLTSPVLLLVGTLVRLDSPGPALYHQERVGQHGRRFTIHKFRTMRQDAEASTGAVWSRVGDTRITAVGRWLRRMRLDELPQLWNVLIGDMSLIGPRPERPEFVAELTRQIPFYGQRHIVKPGLSGWAQVRYTYGASVEDAMEKLQHDLYYVKNMSIALDFFIIFKTVQTVALGRGV